MITRLLIGTALVLIVAWALSGCTTSPVNRAEPYLEAAGESAIETSRLGVRMALWELFKGARIGALMTEFDTPELRAAWSSMLEEYYSRKIHTMNLPEMGDR